MWIPKQHRGMIYIGVMDFALKLGKIALFMNELKLQQT